MDHDHIGPLAVEHLCQVFLDLFYELVCGSGGHDCVNSPQRQVLSIQLLSSGDVDVVMGDHMLQQLLEDWFVARLEMDIEVFIRSLLVLSRALCCSVDEDEYVRTAELAHALADRNYHVVVQALDAETLPDLLGVVALLVQVVHADKSIFLEHLTVDSCLAQGNVDWRSTLHADQEVSLLLENEAHLDPDGLLYLLANGVLEHKGLHAERCTVEHLGAEAVGLGSACLSVLFVFLSSQAHLSRALSLLAASGLCCCHRFPQEAGPPSCAKFLHHWKSL